jgi:hypothetical protein
MWPAKLTSRLLATSSTALCCCRRRALHQFKTAAVEYIRSMGLAPAVIASSNHLGNNDMRNLTSKRTLDAKMRVKGYRPSGALFIL